MHDPPRKDPRKIQVVSTGLAPEETVARIQRLNLGWHFVCEASPPGVDASVLRKAYRSLGYRALTTEWFFEHDMHDIPVFESEPKVRRVSTEDHWTTVPDWIGKKRRHYAEARLFGAWTATDDIGWVESVPVGSDAWVADLYVHQDFRRRGYGRALMSFLLLSDKSSGVQRSVLLASSSGAQLYPHLGYRQTGVLQVFCPLDKALRT